MINAISGYNPYSTYGSYYTSKLQDRAAEKLQAAQRSEAIVTARKVHQPDTPVQPVTPARPVSAQEDPAQAGLLRYGSDPAEMAVRMRIQYPGDDAQQGNAAQAANAEKAQLPNLPGAKDDAQQAVGPARASDAEKAPLPDLPGAKDDAQQAAGSILASDAEKTQRPDLPGAKDDAREADAPALGESKSAQEVMEEGECQTCKERKYQDGSDDPGVSFKTPTNISPDQAASAVRGHENEHVVREQAKAKQEDRKVVSQSVTYHTDICPECGKVYVSGGTTRTVTKADNSEQADLQNQQQNQQDPRKPLSVLA